MYVCMCIHMYVCLYVCMFVCMYMYIYIYIYIHIPWPFLPHSPRLFSRAIHELGAFLAGATDNTTHFDGCDYGFGVCVIINCSLFALCGQHRTECQTTSGQHCCVYNKLVLFKLAYLLVQDFQNGVAAPHAKPTCPKGGSLNCQKHIVATGRRPSRPKVAPAATGPWRTRRGPGQYVCMYIYIYICTYMFVCIMHIYTYICMCIYTYMYILGSSDRQPTLIKQSTLITPCRNIHRNK